MMVITSSSEKRLARVHPDLVRVVRRCAKDWPDAETAWIITCGIRSLAEQKLLVAKGASRTMRSRHLPGAKTGLSHAVDFACTIRGIPRWDWGLYAVLAKRVKAAAKAEKVPIEWGGDWQSFKDGPHFQLPWSIYPDGKVGASAVPPPMPPRPVPEPVSPSVAAPKPIPAPVVPKPVPAPVAPPKPNLWDRLKASWGGPR